MKVLHGMILDSFGRYLHDLHDNKNALKVTFEALEISRELFGEAHERVRFSQFNPLQNFKQ